MTRGWYRRAAQAQRNSFKANTPEAQKSLIGTGGNRTVCPYMAGRHTQDQYRCSECGLIWDVDEERPPCDLTQTHRGDT